MTDFLTPVHPEIEEIPPNPLIVHFPPGRTAWSPKLTPNLTIQQLRVCLEKDEPGVDLQVFRIYFYRRMILEAPVRCYSTPTRVMVPEVEAIRLDLLEFEMPAPCLIYLWGYCERRPDGMPRPVRRMPCVLADPYGSAWMDFYPVRAT